MKKNFYEKIQRYVPFVMIIIFVYMALEYSAGVLLALIDNDMKQVALRLVIVAVSVIGIPVLSKDILPYMDYLTVGENYIERHCLFKKKQKILFDDPECVIGVDVIPHHPRYFTREETRAWIYISTEDYPEDKRGQIVKVKNTQKFIKFPYSRKLAEAILESAQEQKCEELKAFYKKALSEEHIKPYRIG